MENKNNITELVFILDRSGSMSGLESDTIGGFNSLIKKQQKQEGECFVSTVLFDDTSDVLHDRVRLADVKPMTENDYETQGCTALLDAIGDSVRHIGNIHKYARREDVPAHTMFVITTDGMENASRRYNLSDIKRIINRQIEKYGWEFLFIGANIDAVETAASFGIAKERAVNYNADSKGTEIVFDTVSDAAQNFRAAQPLASNWSSAIDNDYKARGNGRGKRFGKK